MLKLAITATVSIIFLSSVNTAVAKDRSTYKHPGNLPTMNLRAKQSKSNAPQSDIKGIDQAINKYFKEKNNKELSNCQTGGSCFFFEIKSLKLVSLSDDNAEILARVESQNYSTERSGSNSSQWTYEKGQIFMPAKTEHMITLKKINQKWKVSVSVI
jgi:hypothetical protein